MPTFRYLLYRAYLPNGDQTFSLSPFSFFIFKDLCTILSNYSNFITIFVALYDIDIILRERIYCFLINILNADIYY